MCLRVRQRHDKEAKLQLLNDIHHLMFITADLDRLISFYERVFEARVTLDLEEEGLRHAYIEVGPHTVPHVFQVPGVAAGSAAVFRTWSARPFRAQRRKRGGVP